MALGGIKHDFDFLTAYQTEHEVLEIKHNCLIRGRLFSSTGSDEINNEDQLDIVCCDGMTCFSCHPYGSQRECDKTA
jgi:hypothetical protein